MTDTLKQIVERYDEAGLEIHLAVESHAVSFKIYELEATMHADLQYLHKGWAGSGDTTTDVEQAEVLMEGRLKWDGCIDLKQGNERYMHFCGRGKFKEWLKLLERVYDLAAVHMPAWNG